MREEYAHTTIQMSRTIERNESVNMQGEKCRRRTPIPNQLVSLFGNSKWASAQMKAVAFKIKVSGICDGCRSE